MKIVFETDNNIKQKVCSEVLRDLPEWFGIEEATKHYIDSVVNYPFITAYNDSNEVMGFYSIREENKATLDMHVLGVKKKYHNQGVGTVLQNYIYEYAKDKGYKYLLVLTLSKSHSDKGYALTRDFYHKNGFIDIYENDKIWGKSSPTQIMIRSIPKNI